MPFRRGAALTTSTTLGFADTADVGPSAGNGFYRRWPDDLAALQDAGITDLRITLDWARLQPKPGALDPDWAERFEQVLIAGSAIGVQVWATLHDGSIPRWFDNEGGLGDGDAFARWWPRWVEAVADRFGDTVDGWVPFAMIPDDADDPWRDTWTILEGERPVIAAIDPESGPFEAIASRADQLGLALGVDWAPDDELHEQQLDATANRWGEQLREAAEDAGAVPLAISGFDARHADDPTAGRIVAALVDVLDDAVDDGLEVELCFVEPAIGGADTPIGVLDHDRGPTAITAAFLAG